MGEAGRGRRFRARPVGGGVSVVGTHHVVLRLWLGLLADDDHVVGP